MKLPERILKENARSSSSVLLKTRAQSLIMHKAMNSKRKLRLVVQYSSCGLSKANLGPTFHFK